MGATAMNNDYAMECILCESSTDLAMYAHRKNKERIIGWIFLCPVCAKKAADKDIEIGFAPEKEDPNEDG
jgi:hypothetical protein